MASPFVLLVVVSILALSPIVDTGASFNHWAWKADSLEKSLQM
jgi:hypothetical protein